jgi:hypothetical protein
VIKKKQRLIIFQLLPLSEVRFKMCSGFRKPTVGKVLTVALGVCVMACCDDSVAGPLPQILTFDGVTNNKAGDVSIGESQLRVVVDDGVGAVTSFADFQNQMTAENLASTVVRFTFFNLVGAQSTLTEIYFEDGQLFGSTPLGTATSGRDVNFASPANPAHPPGGFNATETLYSADADNPGPHNGLNQASDWLSVTFNLKPSVTLATVFDALRFNSTADPAVNLRIGMHVTDFASGGSETFINNPGPGAPPELDTTPAPEPASLALLALGTIGIGGFRLRRKVKAA